MLSYHANDLGKTFTMGMRVVAFPCALLAALLCIAAPGSRPSYAAEASILPPGYEVVTLSTGWIRGSTQEVQCAGLARQHYPNQPYQVISVREEQQFENPTFRTNSRYNYHCTMLVKVRN